MIRIAPSTILRTGFLLLVAAAAPWATAAPVAAAGFCRVSATPINFGLYPALSRGAITTVSAVTYTCTGPIPSGLRLMIGPGKGGSVGRRVMLDQTGKAPLPYILSLDPQGAVPWGDGSQGTQIFFDPHPPPGRSVTIRIYGHIPPDQPVPGDRIYRDSVSVLALY